MIKVKSLDYFNNLVGKRGGNYGTKNYEKIYG